MILSFLWFPYWDKLMVYQWKTMLFCISSSSWLVLTFFFPKKSNLELSYVQQRKNLRERAVSLNRFRAKRQERNYTRKVRYNVRKQVALRYEIHDSMYISLPLHFLVFVSYGYNRKIEVGVDGFLPGCCGSTHFNSLDISYNVHLL